MLDSAALMPLVDLVSSVATGCVVGAITLTLFGQRRAQRARSRRRRAAWLAATLSCRRALPYWLLLAVGAGLVAWSAVPRESLRLIVPGLFTAIVGAGAIGAQILLAAGRIEAEGRVATARALARLSGQTLFVAAAAFVVLAGLAHVVASLVVAFGGVTALLAGLAGKPRPSGAVAVLLAGLGLLSVLVL